jgi:integrase
MTNLITAPGLTARDAERVAAALEAELASSTLEVYASAWRRWDAWCAGRGIIAMPASPETVAAYLAERAEAGLSYGSIDLACSAIGHRHRQHGFPDPTTDLTVRRVRRGLRRILGTAPRRQAHPLSVAEVGQILSAINLHTVTGVRDRAIILLGYAAALRPSEVAALCIADVTARVDGLLVRIRRSKTDPDGHGQLVGVVPGQHRLTDPIDALASWTALRPDGQGPLFTRIHPSGLATADPIDVRTVSRMVQTRARAAGLGGLPVTGHSLRAGHATTAAANGAEVARIALQTRHRDLDTLMEHYIRPTDALASTTSRDLGL